MGLAIALVIGLGVFLAYANGSNDVSKGIATLAGSGLSSYRRAIVWGTIWTGAGGLAGGALAKSMVSRFGKGLLAEGVTPSLAASTAVLVGAATWVMVATHTRRPVSTTHAIVGSIAGVGLVGYGLHGVNWSTFAGKIVLPLMLSPVFSLLITAAILRAWKLLGSNTAECVCASPVSVQILPTGPHLSTGSALIAVPLPALQVRVGSQESCATAAHEGLRLTINHFHWLTSAGVCFARGMNDAPKMVALILALAAVAHYSLTLETSFAMVSIGMMAGSLVSGRRVTHVLAEDITRMDHREGFVANFVTGLLIGPGAALGLPMSTTHVTSGAIVGIGAQSGAGLNHKVLRSMLFAWLITLPAAAAIGTGAYLCFWILHRT